MRNASGLIISFALVSAAALAQDPVPSPAASPLRIPDARPTANPFTKIGGALEPSVVTVTVDYLKQNASLRMQSADPQDEEDSDPGIFGAPNRRMTGMGTGVIVDPRGYVITNRHVVHLADRIRVKLANSTEMIEAKLAGEDPEIDIAILKLQSSQSFAAAPVGDSESVRVGDWAVAIGSPLTLEMTVTLGIVSAKGRNLGDPSHQLQRFLQTDAAINHGNSGGPLCNLEGEVIGINAAFESATGEFEGIGFAIPINAVMRSYKQILQSGKVSRGAIGVVFGRENKPELLKAYGANSGVFVEKVPEGGPAARAGIQPEDIIVALNGIAVQDGDDLASKVSEMDAGVPADVTVLRGGQRRILKLTVGDRAQLAASRAPEAAPAVEVSHESSLGMVLEDLEAGERSAIDPEEKRGVLVKSVEAGGFAEDIGLLRGDVIVAVNRHPVSSSAEFTGAQRRLKKGDAIALRVMRRSGQSRWEALYLAGTLP